MQPLIKRLEPIQDEVIEYVKYYGRFKALTKYHAYVKDYLCFCGWLEDVTGDRNFGVNPVSCRDGCEDIVDAFLDKMLAKVAKLQAENEHLKADNDYLQLLVNQKHQQQEDKVLAAIEAL